MCFSRKWKARDRQTDGLDAMLNAASKKSRIRVATTTESAATGTKRGACVKRSRDQYVTVIGADRVNNVISIRRRSWRLHRRVILAGEEIESLHAAFPY